MSKLGSEAQRERWKRYRKMEKQRSEGFRTFVSKHQQRGQRAEWHDDSADRLLTLGELWDESLQVVRKAASIEEELASAMLFVRAFRADGKNVVGITLRDLLRTLFREWYRAGRPLLNPVQETFSTEWMRQALAEPPNFKDSWEFLDPIARYDVPLFPGTTPVVAPTEQSAEQKLAVWQEELRRGVPTMLYSGVILPHGDE